MSPRNHSEHDERALLDAYRAAACAEADAHFDERALELQRHKILDKLAHLGHPAKVIRFPKAPAGELPGGRVNRRWISAAAAAGLIVGLLGGQLVHLMPQQPRRAGNTAAVAPQSTTLRPGILEVSAPADDDLLDEIEMAMQVRAASELRALDAFTPLPEAK